MKERPFLAVGDRLKRLREAKGLSRREFAGTLKVDVSSIAGWESGKRLPRDSLRRSIARVLGTDIDCMFGSNAEGNTAPISATLVDTVDTLPGLLIDLTRNTRRRMRALRVAAPYATPAYVQVEWRNLVDERLRRRTLEVERIEIFYDLRRLQESLSNIFRYNGLDYHVKSFCAGLTEVVPAMGGYFFDDEEFVLGAYWTGIPPHRRPGIRLSGQPFRQYFQEYWDEIWRRGTLLNVKGFHDLSATRTVALALGLSESEWPRFVAEAETLQVGDGAPPLI